MSVVPFIIGKIFLQTACYKFVYTKYLCTFILVNNTQLKVLDVLRAISILIKLESYFGCCLFRCANPIYQEN